MKSLTREAIQRMVDFTGGSGVGGSGGGGNTAGLASESWVDDNYLSKEFFSALFKVYNGSAVAANEIEPNDELPQTQTNINVKSIFGLWTPKFLSSLGQGSESGGGGSMVLNDLLDVIINNNTLQSGQILVYRNTHWVNEDMPSPGGSGTVTSVGMSVPTGLLVSNGSSQTITNNGTFAITFASGYSLLAASDKTAWDALIGYFDQNGNALKALGLVVASAKTAWGKTYMNANGEPLSISGDMSDVGDIQMSDPTVMSNGRYIYFDEAQDFFIRKISDRFIFKVNGTETINIYNHKLYVATTIETSVGVLSSGYVTALSDIRFKEVVDRFELDIEKIAAASLIHFTWKDRENDRSVHAGGIAQEWQEILPEAVVETEDGKLAMDYGVIGVASAISLARKVKEQQREIDELKRKNAEMEARMERLEKLIMEGGR